MKSLKDILEPVKAALLTVTKDVYHYEALKAEDRYIVWAEDGDNPMYADDTMEHQVIQGTIDYFTSMEYDPNVTDEEFEKYGVGAVRKAAREGDAQHGSFLAGQVAAMVNKEQTCKEIIEDLFTQGEQVLGGAMKWVK